MNLWRFRRSDRWVRLLRTDAGPTRAVFKTMSAFGLLKRFLGIGFFLLGSNRIAVTGLYHFTRDLNEHPSYYSKSYALKFQHTVYSWSQNGLETYKHLPEPLFSRQQSSFNYFATFVPMAPLHMVLFWGTGQSSRALYGVWARRAFSIVRLDRAYNVIQSRFQQLVTPKTLLDTERTIEPFDVSIRREEVRPRAELPGKGARLPNREVAIIPPSDSHSIELTALSSVALSTHDSLSAPSADLPPLYDNHHRPSMQKSSLPPWHTSRSSCNPPASQLYAYERHKPPIPQSELDRRTRHTLESTERTTSDPLSANDVAPLPLYDNRRHISLPNSSLPGYPPTSQQREMRKPSLPPSELDRRASHALERIGNTTRRWEATTGGLDARITERVA